MVRDKRRLQPLDQRGNTAKVRLVQPVGRAERQANGMNRKHIVTPKPLDCTYRRRAAEIVLDMQFEERGCRPRALDLRQMRRAQTNADSGHRLSRR
jgi:hypothetical protein